MFTKYQDDRTREWNNAIERYISLHKYIKEVGKIGISQARSGRVNNDVQTKLADALRQTDTALYKLKEFFKPCLTNIDVTDIFPQDQYKSEGEGLAQEISKLKHENEYLHRQLSDQYKTSGGDGGVQIRDLQQELSFTQQKSERKCETLLKEKRDLEQQILELTEEIEKLRFVANLSTLDEKEIQELKQNGALQVAAKQQKLEETLKIQNDFIYDLKQQLSDCARDRDIFKGLNRTLEMELHKRTRLEHPIRHISKKERFQHDEDLMQDYFNRRTLKIGEKDSQLEPVQYGYNYGQFVYHGNGFDNYDPKYKSLQEIPAYYEHERTYLKSKSYDFDKNYINHDDSVTLRDNNSQENLQGLEKEIRYHTDQLQKINEEEEVNQGNKENVNSTKKNENN